MVELISGAVIGAIVSILIAETYHRRSSNPQKISINSYLDLKKRI
ncbi:MAG: hypothetical protein PVG39_28410 [Desulfobacteraceae bacterium]|jgi:hypothetical protein